MKTVILAGGFGTRISEDSHLRPKPMIEIGGKPILWHVMKIYSQYGYNDFIICCGYKSYVVKEYFANYCLHNSDVIFDFTQDCSTQTLESYTEPWKVTLIDTGLNTMTGGRLRRVRDYIGGNTFMLTYGDGVCDVDIGKLLDFHRSHGKKATLTAIQPSGRFGMLSINGSDITAFSEKKKESGEWINGGFMVLEPDVFSYIKDDSTILEKEPMEALTREGELKAYCYNGFWQCMDTQKDRMTLDNMIESGNTPWLR